jgi:hypothetical protein
MKNNQTEDDPSIRYFSIYVNLFYLIFGNIGNLFKIAFFLQKPLRSLPCSIYILFSTFCNFITLNNLPVLQLLIYLYPNYHWIKVTVDWAIHQNGTITSSNSVSTHDLIICRLRTYLHMLSTDLSFQMLLFASINRFCTTYRRKRGQNKTNFLIRYFCDYPNVYKLCIILSIISILLSLQHVFNFTIDSTSEGCIPHNELLWAVWRTSIHCFLLPILMIIFGILTLRNIRYSSLLGGYIHCLQCRRRRRRHHHHDHHHDHHHHHHHHHQRRKDQFVEGCSFCSHSQTSIQYQIDIQLTSMIISEIFVTVLTLLPCGAYAFYHLLHKIQDQTVYYTNRRKWVVLFIRMTMYFEPSCGFYIYLTTLTVLRKRFCKMFIENLSTVCNFCCKK